MVIVVVGRVGGNAVIDLASDLATYCIEVGCISGECSLVAARKTIESNILLCAAAGIVIEGINKA